MIRARAAIAAATAALAIAILCSPVRSQNPSSGDWTAKTFPAAFEDFFPIKLAEGDFIAVRVHRSNLNDLREYSIVFEDAPDSKSLPAVLRAVVREAQGSPLYQQLASLHAELPSASYQQLKHSLKVSVWTLSPDRCPAVATQFKAFQDVQFVRPRDEDEIEENPVLYEFNETFAGGGSVLEYMDNRALPRWARATHDALDACVASGNATAN
ncbi:MAG: hypothetical protein ACRD5K_15435 [Candidatus Acidiferrales bacterium]